MAKAVAREEDDAIVGRAHDAEAVVVARLERRHLFDRGRADPKLQEVFARQARHHQNRTGQKLDVGRARHRDRVAAGHDARVVRARSVEHEDLAIGENRDARGIR